MLKRILFKHKKAFYYSWGFYLIIFCTYILPFSLQATEEYKIEDSINASKRIDIVSPEAVEIVKKLNFLSTRYPEISKQPPHIDSKESFQLAKQHLLLTQSMGQLLFATLIQSSKVEFLGEFYHLCNAVIPYIEVLRAPSCSAYRTEVEEKELENEFYKTTYYIGRNYLMAYMPLRNTGNLHLFPQCVNQIKLIKATLRNNTHYYRLLQETIANAQAFTPGLTAYLDSSDNLGSIKASSSKKMPKKIQQLKDLNFHQKLAEFTESALQGPYKECFDLYFHATVNKILTDATLQTLKSSPYDEYVADLQKLADNYLTLENEGAKFRNTLLPVPVSVESSLLNQEQLRNLYEFFSQRYSHLPQKDPILLLQHVVILFVNANKLPDALLRTEVLKELLLQKGELHDTFIKFRARILALNGDHQEWITVSDQHRKAKAQRKILQHSQKVIHIKKAIKQDQEREKIKRIEAPARKSLQEAAEQELRQEETASSFGFEVSTNPLVNYKSETIVPRQKVKTRKTIQTLNAEATSAASSSIPKPLSKDYFISNNAFKTYTKIRIGNWKFARKDLCNLFEKLGCKVDVSQGKGDHTKITLPLDITIKKEGNLVAVLPEFITKEVSILTIPNWDSKWDGEGTSLHDQKYFSSLECAWSYK